MRDRATTISHYDGPRAALAPRTAAFDAVCGSSVGGVRGGRRRAESGTVENEWSIKPLRVRGIERVRLHADLTILATLSCALARARSVPRAA
jgi:hypothetical protein